MSQKVGSKDARLKSKGCLPCIRMKVKCDQQKPQCQRCERADRECRYRDPNAVVFRMDSSATSAQEEALRRRELMQRHSPPPSVSTDWVQNAVSHYFFNFSLPSQNGFPGLFEFLPALYAFNTQTPCFRNAVDAVSLANLALVKQMGEPYLGTSRRLYNAAVQQLGLALNSNEARSPAVLGTASLLWQYDIIMGEDYLASRSAHRKGQIELLRLRLAEMPDKEHWLNRSVLAGVQMLDIGTSKTRTPNLPSVEDISPSIPTLYLLRRIMPEVGAIGAAVSALLQQTPTFEEVSSYAQQLQDIDNMMQTWQDQLPMHMRYSSIANPLPRDKVPYPEDVILLPCMNSAGVWTSYWLARLSILRNMIMLHPTATAAGIYLPSKQQIRENMLDIVDNICSAIPHMLGRTRLHMGMSPGEPVPAVGAMFSTRALFICGQITGLPEIQRNWILQCLYYIGNEKGIRQALLLRQELLRTPVRSM